MGVTREQMQKYHQSFQGEYSTTKFLKLKKHRKDISGLALGGANTIIHLKDGKLHNDAGPAYIVVGAQTGEVIAAFYFLEGKKLQRGDVVRDMLELKEKRAIKHR